MKRTGAPLALPEFHVLLFAVLLNYPWEFIQSPLYAGMADERHWDAVKTCTVAALGDGVLMVVAYWGAALFVRSRRWIVAPGVRALVAFLLIGVCIAICIELLARRGWWLQQWQYSEAMPLIPGLGVGWIPVLQWLILPPLVIGLVSRQLRGS